MAKEVKAEVRKEERQEKVLVRVAGEFFVESVVSGKVRAERKEGEE